MNSRHAAALALVGWYSARRVLKDVLKAENDARTPLEQTFGGLSIQCETQM